MNFLNLKNYPVLESTISNELLIELKNQCKKLIKKNKNKMNSLLTGNKPPHIFLDNPIKLFDHLSKMIEAYEKTTNYSKSFSLLTVNANLAFTDPWVNVMADDQYISNHIHDGIYAFSCWVDIPYKTIFEFSYSNIIGQHWREQFTIDKSYEGKIFLFPSSLVHCTYTLEKSNKKRLCVSGNVGFNNSIK